MTPLDFAAVLMAYCTSTRASVTSWGRSPERNASVGGHTHSYHQVWLGGDVGYAPNPTPPLATARKRASQLGLRLVREGDHDHLQPLGR